VPKKVKVGVNFRGVKNFMPRQVLKLCSEIVNIVGIHITKGFYVMLSICTRGFDGKEVNEMVTSIRIIIQVLTLVIVLGSDRI
jgi:hypothetical protein